MLESLKEAVFDANMELVRNGLVTGTFGNVSGIARAEGLVVIKPSGIPYDGLGAGDMVVTGLDGSRIEGQHRPSSDLPTHLVLYRALPGIGGVAHTHSRYATAWAQARREIPCLGTTHADYFDGAVPVTDAMAPEEIATAYEANTGHAIVRRLQGLDPERIPAILVASHGPFCWAASAPDAAHVAAVLEEIARVALYTVALNPAVEAIPRALHHRHYTRKHGPGAYYGQP